MFSRPEALPESESRHELGAKEGFMKGEIGRLRKRALRSLDFVVGEVKT
jgi:hypothetical protein